MTYTVYTHGRERERERQKVEQSTRKWGEWVTCDTFRCLLGMFCSKRGSSYCRLACSCFFGGVLVSTAAACRHLWCMAGRPVLLNLDDLHEFGLFMQPHECSTIAQPFIMVQKR